MNNLQAHSCQESILVVDDTTANLDILRRILSSKGYEVRPATSGNIALQAVELFQPDLILLDVMMPEMSGYEVCSRLKADPATQDIPIIFISAFTEVFDKVQAFEMGAMDYIAKPFQEQEILARVENQLRIRRLSQDLLAKNLQLSQEIAERKLAQASLQQAQSELQQYTISLEKVNQELEQTLEELQVTQGKLQQQNEYLATSRLLIEREQQRYQNLFDFAPDGYVVTDALGRIREANQATAALLYQEQEFLIGKPLSIFIPQSERSAFRTQLEQLGKRPHPAKKWELNLKPKRGKVFPAAITVGTISDEHRKLLGFRWLIRDITASKRAEAALSESEQKYRHLVEASQDMIWSIDTRGCLTFVNKAVKKIYGYEPEQMLGRPFSNFTSPENIALNQEVFQGILQGESIFQYETTNLTKDGKLIQMMLNAIALRDSSGKIIGATGTANDITERKLAEEKLKKSEANLATAQKIAHLGSWEFDVITGKNTWSAEVFRIFGLDPASSEPTYSELLERIHIDDRALFQAQIKQAITEGKPYRIEFRIKLPNGKIRDIEGRGEVVFINDQQRIKLFGTVMDITQRKEAEIARRTLQEQLQAILDNSPALIYLMSSDHKYLLSNRQLDKLFNNNKQQLIGKSIYEIWPQEIADVFAKNNQKVLTGGVPIEVEENIPHKDGLHTYITSKFPLHDVNGVPYAVCGVSTDITERKKTQEKLQQQKELLQTIFDHIPVMISLCDSNGQLVLFNRHLERVLGWTEAELGKVDMLAEGYPNPEYRQQVLDVILAATGEWYDMKTRAKNGHFVDTSWANIRLSDGSYIGIGQDITDRKQRELLNKIHKFALEMVAKGNPLHEIFLQLTHHLARLAPQMHASILLIDENGQQSCAFVNPKLSPSFVLAITSQQIAQNAGSSERAAYFGKRVIVEDIATDPLWTNFKDLALAQGLAACWSEPILSEKGQVLGTFELYFTEARSPNSGELTIIESLARLTSLIIERKHLEAAELKKTQELEQAYRELKRTQSKLIQAEKMSSLGQLVAGVAHEINNPVSFIHGNLNHAKNYFQDLLNLVELYQQTYPNPSAEIQALTSEIDLDFMVEDWSKLLNSMRVGTQRITDIVVSLRNFSRLDEKELKSVDIHEGIDSTLLLLQHRLRAEGDCPEIEVIKNYGQLPRLDCYASQLNQVFMHLLNNAIDALQSKSSPRRITISTEIASECCSIVSDNKQQATSYIVIKIADNGPGISEETQQRIFDPFFTTKPVGSGTGLGLAISHQIVVEKHQGQISCISELGQKTEMIVEIPLKMGNRELVMGNGQLVTGNWYWEMGN